MDSRPHAGSLTRRALDIVPAAVALALFVAALEILRLELRTIGWTELTRDLIATPPIRLVLALALTAANYLVLTGYDLVACRYAGTSLPRTRILFASFVAYAVSNNVGFATLSGTSVRYRYYTRWGVTGEELARIVFSCTVTFWLGLLALGGTSLLAAPPPRATSLPHAGVLEALGWILLLVPAAYLVLCATIRRPLRLRGMSLPLPGLSVAGAQLLVSALDWILAGAVLYVLLPEPAPPFAGFLGAFFVAVLAGLISHVPGGLGVFESVLLLLLSPQFDSTALVPALLVYRVVYYLVPLTAAIAAVAVDEATGRRDQVSRIGTMVVRVSLQIMPRLIALCAFATGLLLLLSGATPAVPGRVSALARVLPLALIELSHFVGSIVGVALLLLSQGLARRLDGAYYVTVWLLGVGIAASLLKAFDYEEALLLTVVLLIMVRSRDMFTRRAALLDTRFAPSWVASIAGAVAASIWLGFFAYKHVQYSSQLWWQFELHGDASRFLRATVGATTLLLIAALGRLIGYAPHETQAPTDDELEAARAIVAGQPATAPNLVFLRDKALIFDDDRTAFVMYGVQGRTWVAYGDPVGAERQFNVVIRRFLERAQDYGGVPVFYEVAPAHLHRYVDFGLTFVKLGEEARIDLAGFSLAGPDGARLRHAIRHVEREGGRFRIVPAQDVAALLPELRAVSDEWLAAKSAAEKGFSLGFFDEAYLRRFPIAVIEQGERVLAFANLWQGADGELSVDLMRHRRGAPNSVMEALFGQIMQWGHEHGCHQFVLGMAPLSGFEESPVAPLWSRIGAFIYQHGEGVYNFQGLRAYKAKFKPAWEPRYLAYPGGLRLPRILADISALIAGGYAQILAK